MAYESVKNQIDAYIKANGVNLITGPVLNAVLTTMLDELGEGYAFQGVIYATDTPSPAADIPQAWLASAGTYLGGSITVDEGELALIIHTVDGWSKETVYRGVQLSHDAIVDALGYTPADDADLAGKQDTIADLSAIRSGAALGSTSVQPADIENMVEAEPIGSIIPPVNPSEFATKEELSQLGQKVVEKVDISGGQNNLFNPKDKDVIIGKYINASGAAGTGNYNASGYIPVEAGKTYYCSIQDGAGFRFACFYDSSKAVISNSLTWPSRSFTTPSGCAFVRVSFYQAHYNYAQVSPIYGNYNEFIPIGKYIEPLQDRTDSIEQKVGKTSVPFFDNVYIDLSASVGGVVTLKGIQNASWSSTTAKVEEGDIISFRVYSGSIQRGFAFLDADNKLIEKETTVGGVVERTIIVPTGAKTLICNSETAQTHFLFISKKYSLQNLFEYFTNVPKSQLFDRALVEIGYCSTSGYVDSQSTGYVHTPKIDVSKYIGRTIYFSVNGVALTSNSFRFITVYDANGVAQPSLGVASPSLNIPTFIVPEGASNIVISYLNPASSADMAYFQAEFDAVTPFATYELVPELDFSLIKKNVDYEISKSIIPTQVSGNILQGKKWVACGDSFTHGDFTNAPENNYTIEDGIYQGHYKVYPYLIGNRNNMVIVNEAVNGSTMTYVDGQGFSKSNGRYTQIPADADYITLKFGINDDTNHKGVTIGTIDDNTNETFYGAWNIVMDYLIQNHPQAKIGIIVTNGSTLDIVNATIAIAEKWGIPYLNEATDKQCSFMFRSNRTDVVSSVRYLRNINWYVHPRNNAHPNALAHEYESTVIEAWLRTL